jgi:hypothetical protein
VEVEGTEDCLWVNVFTPKVNFHLFYGIWKLIDFTTKIRLFIK